MTYTTRNVAPLAQRNSASSTFPMTLHLFVLDPRSGSTIETGSWSAPAPGPAITTIDDGGFLLVTPESVTRLDDKLNASGEFRLSQPPVADPRLHLNRSPSGRSVLIDYDVQGTRADWIDAEGPALIRSVDLGQRGSRAGNFGGLTDDFFTYVAGTWPGDPFLRGFEVMTEDRAGHAATLPCGKLTRCNDILTFLDDNRFVCGPVAPPLKRGTVPRVFVLSICTVEGAMFDEYVHGELLDLWVIAETLPETWFPPPIAVTPDGRYIAMGFGREHGGSFGFDPSMYFVLDYIGVYDTVNYRWVMRLDAQDAHISSTFFGLALSPDGSILAVLDHGIVTAFAVPGQTKPN